MPNFSFQCIARNKVCDGKIDCVTTGKDEKNCEGIRTKDRDNFDVTTFPSDAGDSPIKLFLTVKFQCENNYFKLSLII